MNVCICADDREINICAYVGGWLECYASKMHDKENVYFNLFGGKYTRAIYFLLIFCNELEKRDEI